MAGVNFYFEYRNTHRVQLPVNPTKLSIKAPSKSASVDVVNLGDVSILKTPGLQTLEVESFIPAVNAGSYVQPGVQVYAPEFYRDFFQAVQRQKEPVNFIVTGLNVNLQMSVEDFEFWWEGSDPDMHFRVSLKEYQRQAARVTITRPTNSNTESSNAGSSSAGSGRANVAKKVAIGSKVVVNGQLFKTSYKQGGGVTEKNAVRKVNFIKTGRACPYHVTTLEGGWRGWVTADSVEVVD